MNNLFLSKFTPSLMSKDNLRAIFVQRDWLLKHLLEGLRESVSTKAKHNYLLVGPRGIGKTHLVSLISYALREESGCQKKFKIGWLREEEWGVSSYLDLLVRILRSLADQSAEQGISEAIEALTEYPLEGAESAAQELLLEFLNQRTLVIIAENLNTLFEGLGDIGQKRFRALIQETGLISIVATTPVLFADVYLQSSPFYGFFEVHHLDELSVNEARQLLLRIADLEHDEQLLAFINSSEGQARIQAIYHLAGGNHRVYIILCQFLRHNDLDQLVGLMLGMIDDLTPYYQSQISALSTQQQKIIDVICNKRHAIPVKEIAAQCFITQQTASSQLKDLKDKRFVVSVPVGREQWYELREPLMRICIETKKQRGKPIELLVEMLRTWYSTHELKKIVSLAEPSNQISNFYLRAAWSSKIDSKGSVPKLNKAQKQEVRELEKSIIVAAENEDRATLVKLLERLVHVRGAADDWHKYAFCLVMEQQLLRALDAIEKALSIAPNLDQARQHRLVILMKIGRYEEALSYTDEWLQKKPSNTEAMDFKGCLLALAGRVDEALEVFIKLTEMAPGNSEAWSRLGGTFIKLRRFDEGIKALDQALSVDGNNTHALSLKGYLSGYRGDSKESIRCFARVIKLDSDNESAWIGKCMALINIGEYQEALSAAEAAMDVDGESLRAHFYRVVALFCNRRWSHYKKELDALLVRSRKVRQPIGDFGVLLRFLLEKIQDKELWHEKSEELLLACRNHNTVVQLSTGLVNTVPSLVSEEVSEHAAQSWLDMWKDLARKDDAFNLSLRLMSVAVSYKRTKNIEEARTLVSEERELFENLLQEVTAFHTDEIFDKMSSRK